MMIFLVERVPSFLEKNTISKFGNSSWGDSNRYQGLFSNDLSQRERY